jgi:dihydroorotate dehydrogenase (NAD+) catalytic subunit
LGASAIQVGTASFVSPDATVKLLEGLENWCRNENINNINCLRGTLDVTKF